jgi:hypothetical protein
MTRALVAAALLLAFAPVARAQDMPLAQILIDGEGWKKVEGNPAKPRDQLLTRVGSDGGIQRMSAVVGGREIIIAEGSNLTDAAPHALAVTPDGNTAYVGYPSRKAVWAYRVTKEGKLIDGAPYAPLRLRQGQPYLEVTGIVFDRDGRTYAATPSGVHVYDPTGRLCGVLTVAGSGRPESLAFEGDQLTLRIGEVKYTRKLNTAGVK